jgi:hypothetical protein
MTERAASRAGTRERSAPFVDSVPSRCAIPPYWKPPNIANFSPNVPALASVRNGAELCWAQGRRELERETDCLLPPPSGPGHEEVEEEKGKEGR